MTFHLHEINRVLLSANNLSQEIKGAKKEYVINDLSTISILAGYSDHEYNIEICKKINLIQEEKNRLYITKEGKEFFSLRSIQNGVTNVDLNQNQKNFLLKLVLELSNYKKYLEKIVSELKLDFKRRVWFYRWNISKTSLPKELLNILFQLDFFVTQDNRTEISKNNSYYVSRLKHRVPRSEEDLFKMLNKQRKIGENAEKLTMNYEKNRLKNGGYPDLALSIQCISKEDVFAGYDIMSYNGKGSTLTHDRMIEVKGTSGSYPILYWSKNEIETAKRLQKKYWIYLWTEVKSGSDGNLFDKIQDPYKKFFQRKEKKPEPVIYMIKL